MEVPATKECLDAALEGLVLLNVAVMNRSALPPLYDSGVRYQDEAPGHEDWRHAEIVYRDGYGDCEDLATYRAAELRVHLGEPAEAFAVRTGHTHTGANRWHALVRRADGTIEDPSRALGMGRSKRRGV